MQKCLQSVHALSLSRPITPSCSIMLKDRWVTFPYFVTLDYSCGSLLLWEVVRTKMLTFQSNDLIQTAELHKIWAFPASYFWTNLNRSGSVVIVLLPGNLHRSQNWLARLGYLQTHLAGKTKKDCLLRLWPVLLKIYIYIEQGICSTKWKALRLDLLRGREQSLATYYY